MIEPTITELAGFVFIVFAALAVILVFPALFKHKKHIDALHARVKRLEDRVFEAWETEQPDDREE